MKINKRVITEVEKKTNGGNKNNNTAERISRKRS